MEGTMAKYVRTNCKTKIIEPTIKNRVNKTGLVATIAYKNRGVWFSSADFMAAALEDGVVISPNSMSPILVDLSGHSSGVLPEYQRNVLIRSAATEEDFIDSGYDIRTKWFYMFNDRGTMDIKGALGTVKVERLTKASFIIKTKKKK
jgi:hypothetical protein